MKSALILASALLIAAGCTTLPLPEEDGVVKDPGNVTPTKAERVAAHPATAVGCQVTQVAVFAAICGPCAAFPALLHVMEAWKGDTFSKPKSELEVVQKAQGATFACIAGFM